MKRTNKNRQAEYLQTGKSERTAVRAAKCVTDYGRKIPTLTSARIKAETNRSRLSCKHRKSKRGNVYTSAEKFMRKSLSLPVGWETV